jgi:hypothetical protein
LKRTLTLGAAALCAAAAFAARPLEWQNLDAAHHLAGRMASSGYLRGKVVYVDCRDYGDKSSAEAVRRMEEAWQTFKMKQFVMIGSHRGEAGAEKVKRIAEELGLSYPIYADAGVARTPEQEEAELAAKMEESMNVIISVKGKNTMVWLCGDEVHDLTHPDDIVALDRAWGAGHSGAKMPRMEMEPDWFARLCQCCKAGYPKHLAEYTDKFKPRS